MTIICTSAFTLTSERGTPCHLMRAIAKYVPVIYINPPLSLVRWRKEREKLPLKFDEDFRVITPVLPLTFRFLPRKFRRWIVASLAIPKILRQLEESLKPPLVLWSYLGELTLPLTHRLKADLLCYHRLDDYSVLLPKDRPLERKIEQKSDLLFVVSPVLQEQYQRQGRSAILLPNGVDVQHFVKALDSKTEIPDEIAHLPTPRIGFVGTIDPKWVDTDLLLTIAKTRPQWSLVVIGSFVNWSPPENLPQNIHFLGSRPYEKLPCYLKGLDVCLVPFKDNAISRAASPLKLYEYLAAGRAVVSSPVPDQAYFAKVTWLAWTTEEFLCAIEEALKVAHDPKEQERRISAASKHSWQQRAETALWHIQNALKTRQIQTT